MSKSLRFAGFNCIVERSRYSNNNRTALLLIDAEDGEPVATATVNLPEVEMAPGEVAIKNWSENEGMVEVLVQAGVIEPPHREIALGYVIAPVCRIREEG